jgi:hypothetical protein
MRAFGRETTAAWPGARKNTISFDLDGLGIVVGYNTVNDAALFQTGWPAIRAAIEATAWPARANHFPAFGMPAFR